MRNRNFSLVLFILLLTISGCSASQTEILDYSPHSTVYGWMDIKEIDANRIHAIYMYQFKPKTKEPYYPMAFEEFKDGYLFYHYGLINGVFKLDEMRGQSCLGFMCSNTTYIYNIGKQGNKAGAIRIKKPGVFYLGSYKFKEVKTGFFQPGKFDILKAKNAPTRKEMLEFILKNTPKKHPIVGNRIKAHMKSLKNK